MSKSKHYVKGRPAARVPEQNTLQYWDKILSRWEIAIITCLRYQSLSWWRRNCIPNQSVLLLRLYTGDLTLADWEDIVQEDTVKANAKHRAYRRELHAKKRG